MDHRFFTVQNEEAVAVSEFDWLREFAILFKSVISYEIALTSDN
jgi:hypothetical protein